MQADRNTIITTGMNFSDQDAAVFWPIYREYEFQRSKLDDRRMVVIKQYTQKYPILTDTEAKNMAEQMLDCDWRLLALKKAYFKKFNKALPALTVSKFFSTRASHRLDDGRASGILSSSALASTVCRPGEIARDVARILGNRRRWKAGKYCTLIRFQHS
jgi:hypothetical protein